MVAQNPFSLTPQEIEHLGYADQAALVNRLISNRGSRLGIDPVHIRTTSKLTEKDEGIDALTNLGGVSDPHLISGLTVWQYKASWPGEKNLEKELNKSGVQAAFKDGANYVLVVGKSMAVGGKYGQVARQKILSKAAKDAGCSGNVRLVTTDVISAWLSEDPAALFEVRPQVHGFVTVRWVLQRDPRHAIGFEPDDQRREIIKAIRVWLDDRDPQRTLLRIQGVAGVGKTRLALEVVRSAGLEDTVLYNPEVPINLDIFDWIASNQQAQTVLIIDECEVSVVQNRLESRVRYCDGRLRLITIGPGGNKSDVFALGVLDDDAMTRVVNDAGGMLPDGIVRWIVEKTRGFVKLAYVVAQAMAKGGVRSVSDLPNDSEVSGLVQRMLIPTKGGQDALQGIALLSRVGFRDGVEAEGQSIASFIGIDWNRMQILLGDAIKLGIVSTRGRYWYVTPELLALWLAEDFWRSQSHRIQEFVDKLPSSEAVSAFNARFQGLGEIPEAKEVVEQVLGARGPFQSIESLNDNRLSSLFSALAQAVPVSAAMAALRLISTANKDQLLEFGKGRRELVWALENLLVRRDTFHTAIQAIKLLAESENESFTNNATGVWADAFLTILAQTEVPFSERLYVLDQALRSGSAASRRLGVVGLASALKGNESNVLQGTNAGIPREVWRPKNYGELRPLKHDSLKLLALVVNDPDETVRGDAIAVLQESLRHLAGLRLTREWVDVARLVDHPGDTERRNLWSAIQLTLKYEASFLSESDRDLLGDLAQRFFSAAFSDRLRRYLGRGIRANNILDEDEWTEALANLAREAFSSKTDLESELSWLVSGEAEQLWPFAVELGRLDGNRQLLDILLLAVDGAKDPRLLAGYLMGLIESGDEEVIEWRESLLDDLSGAENTAILAWDATIRGPASDRGLQRLLRINDRGWGAPEALALLRYGGWPIAVSIESFIALVRSLRHTGSPDTMTSALMMLEQRIASYEDLSVVPPELIAVAWELLEDPSGWSHEPMLSWSWEQLGAKMMELNPVRVAELVVRVETLGQPAYHDSRLQLLEQAASAAPEEVWHILGESFLGDNTPRAFIWEIQTTGLLSNVPVQVIANWIRAKGCSAARVLAQAISLEGDTFPELARVLLRACPQETEFALAREFSSGVWIGDSEPFWQGRLDLAVKLARDDDASVANWASKLIPALQDQVTFARRDDEEREFR